MRRGFWVLAGCIYFVATSLCICQDIEESIDKDGWHFAKCTINLEKGKNAKFEYTDLMSLIMEYRHVLTTYCNDDSYKLTFPVYPLQLLQPPLRMYWRCNSITFREDEGDPMDTSEAKILADGGVNISFDYQFAPEEDEDDEYWGDSSDSSDLSDMLIIKYTFFSRDKNYAKVGLKLLMKNTKDEEQGIREVVTNGAIKYHQDRIKIIKSMD